ncbi:hypothetical protein [Nitrosomonas sp. Nm132]|uniref:hypothetical protein n=1 Tax=Nitrosomonas sp. Nm132 TaxID=1881053 RepID=UPI000884C92F|nr:hypothetical protein [Nitrosomonas sp. Nm132]SDH25690.1 hypothetical protein SAMN05428952_100920 [Nitrosomonas sp. Nm132]
MSYIIRWFVISAASIGSILFSTTLLAVIPYENNNQTLNILHRLFNVSIFDHFTLPMHYGSVPPSGYAIEGQQFYVPSCNNNPLSGTQKLYGLYANSITDHMIAEASSVSGYTNDQGIMGCPYTTQIIGTQQILRWWNVSNTNHLAAFPKPIEDPTSAGFTKDNNFFGYGFPRYKAFCEAKFNGSPGLDNCGGTQITVGTNAAAGSAIFTLTWNGKQFINDWDYGRQIQIAENSASSCSGYNCADNPTEAGDKWGCNRPNSDNPPHLAWRAHGSPTISYSCSNKILNTSTYPLQWEPQLLAPNGFPGGEDNPVGWIGTFSKKLTFDFQSRPNIIQFQTTIKYPTAENQARQQVTPAVYLTEEFTRAYKYEGGTVYQAGVPRGALSGDLDPTIPTTDPYYNCLSVTGLVAGGVIRCNDTNSHCLGIYQKHIGNHVNHGICKTKPLGRGTDQYGWQTRSLATFNIKNPIPAGDLIIKSYLVVGSLTTVQSEMDWLRVNNY